MYRLTELLTAFRMAECIPTNDLLTGPLGPIITTLTGAVGGLLEGVAVMAIIVFGILAIAFIVSNKGSMFMKAIARVVGVLLALPLVIMIMMSLYAFFKNACPVL